MSIKNGYGFCMNEWALDKSIKSELGLLLIISSLSAERGYCYSSNKYLAQLFEVDEVTISRKIKKLIDKQYISVYYKKRGAEIIRRDLRLTKMLTDDLQKSQSTINKNVKENNININNITPIVPLSVKKFDKDVLIPSLDEFLDYAHNALEKRNLNYTDYEHALKFKYDAWKENNWCTGGDKSRVIKKWKTTLLNTLPYLKKTESNGKQTTRELARAAKQAQANRIKNTRRDNTGL